jgi:hypothetical protein
MGLAYPLLSEFGMAPLLISGIASVANTAIDAWSNHAQRNLAVKQAQFDNAFGKAMGIAPNPTLAQPPTAQSLESQLRNAPEIRGVLDIQDPSNPTKLNVTSEGRVFLQVGNNQPSELAVSLETRDLARQLNSALNGGASLNPSALNSASPLRTFSTSSSGTLAAYAR